MSDKSKDGKAGENPFVPELNEEEEQQASQRSALPVSVVHEAIRKEGEDELNRPNEALAWSGLAAGLSMGFSFVTEAVIRSLLPTATWTPLLTKFGYCIGFLIVVLGRQQLFTENTVTVILPLMARRNLETFLSVLRLWSVVFLANIAGALLFAWAAGHLGVFDAPVQHAFAAIGHEAMKGNFNVILCKAIFAGWLIALMVWLLPVADHSRVPVIIILTYVVGLGGFSHVIVGSIETLYLATLGLAPWSAVLLHFMLPTLIGNIVGGVSFVAALNHAQSVAGHGKG